MKPKPFTNRETLRLSKHLTSAVMVNCCRKTASVSGPASIAGAVSEVCPSVSSQKEQSGDWQKVPASSLTAVIFPATEPYCPRTSFRCMQTSASNLGTRRHGHWSKSGVESSCTPEKRSLLCGQCSHSFSCHSFHSIVYLPPWGQSHISRKYNFTRPLRGKKCIWPLLWPVRTEWTSSPELGHDVGDQWSTVRKQSGSQRVISMHVKITHNHLVVCFDQERRAGRQCPRRRQECIMECAPDSGILSTEHWRPTVVDLFLRRATMQAWKKELDNHFTTKLWAPLNALWLVDLPRGTWCAHALAVAYAFSPSAHLLETPTPPGGLDAKHSIEIWPRICLDLLHIDDHEFSRQVVARLSFLFLAGLLSVRCAPVSEGTKACKEAKA